MVTYIAHQSTSRQQDIIRIRQSPWVTMYLCGFHLLIYNLLGMAKAGRMSPMSVLVQQEQPIPYTQITKAIGSIKHQSDTFASDRWPIDVDPRVFVIKDRLNNLSRYRDAMLLDTAWCILYYYTTEQWTPHEESQLLTGCWLMKNVCDHLYISNICYVGC